MTGRARWSKWAVESAIIVGSILLAFAIQAWWDGAQEEARLDVALANLEVALSQSRDLLSAEAERLDARQEVLTGFLSRDPEELGSLPSDSVREILGEIFRPRVSGLNSDEIIALLDNPSLYELADPEFRRLRPSGGRIG